MNNYRPNFLHWFRLFLASAAVAGMLPSLAAAKPKKTDLGRLVVVGDSLSAGFQNFSLYNSESAPNVPNGGQMNGYASLIAQQAGATLTLPLISYPGIPPALTFVNGQVLRSPGNGMRTNPAVQATNLSVPGFTLADALGHSFPGTPATNAIDALADSILAEPGTTPGCGVILSPAGAPILSEVACAMALKPSTIIVDIGNNDALGSLTFGLPPTDPAVFQAEYHQLLTSLASTGANIAIANIPDVTSVPFLVPVPAFQQACPSAQLPAGTTPADFVVPNLQDVTNPQFNVCTSFVIRPAALIQAARNAVAAYNTIINHEAAAVGAVVVDINGLMKVIGQFGFPVRGTRLTTAYLGGIFSLDGIHPTNTGYAIIADAFILRMNEEFHLKIPLVSVADVATNDPLVFTMHGGGNQGGEDRDGH